MLAMMAGGVIDELGRRNFEAMAEQLQNKLREDGACVPSKTQIPRELTPPRDDKIQGLHGSR